MSERKISNFRTTPEMIREARKKARIKRKLVRGSVIALTAGVVGLGIIGCSNVINKDSKDNKNVITTVNTNEDIYEVDIATDEILDLTLVNDGFDEAKFDDAVKELQSTGLNCEGVGIADLDVSNIDSYFLIGITPYEGDTTKVIANDNLVNPASDQLAVAMSVSSGHDATDIQKGVHDLGKADGTFKPSSLEEKVRDVGIPNITVAYPSDEDIDTDEILEACARVTYYYKQDGCSARDEMLYRVKSGDSPYSLGKDICRINGIGETDVLDGNSILLMKPLSGSFSKDAIIDIEMVDVKSNSLN